MNARQSKAGAAAEHGRHRLRGRQHEVAGLRAHLASLSQGRGTTVLVQGSPGLGKTRLLAEARQMAEETGLRVIHGGGDPDSQTIPFGALLGALHSAPHHILPPDAVQDPPETSASRYWLLQEVHEHLERAALAAPVVIVLDDLQWCDEGTLLALRTLPRRLAMHPVAWILATRTGPLAPDVRATLSALDLSGAHLLTLAPLGSRAVAAMTGDLLAATPDDALLELAQRAQGQPLLLNELINGVLDEGAVAVAGGVARLTRRRLPLRFHASVQHRLEQVSPPARKAAQIAAVLGRAVAVDQLAELTGEPAATLLDALEELLQADLLTETGGSLVFSHDLIREAVRAALPATLRRALRREAVDLRLAQGVPVVRVAADLAEIAEPGDHSAVALLRQAARELASMTPSAAVEMSRRAIELSAPDPLRQAALIAEALPLFSQTGQAGEAYALAESALARPLPVEVEANIRLGLALVADQRSVSEAVRQSRAGLALPGLPARTRTQLLATLVVNLALLDEDGIAEAGRLLPEALVAATQAADQASRATLLGVGSIIAEHRLEVHRALDLADQAVSVAGDLPQGEAPWLPRVWKSLLLSALGQVEQALAEADDGVRRARHLGQTGLLPWGMARCRIFLDAGRLGDARAEAEAVLAMARELGPGSFDEAAVRHVLARIALHTGHPEEPDQGRAPAGVLLAAEAGQGRAVLGAEAGGGGRGVSLLLHPGDPVDEVVLVRRALRAGDRAGAIGATEFAETRHRANPGIPIFTATALHARALLAGDRALLARSVQLYRDLPRPLVLAAALEDTGTIDCLDDALSLYEQAEAVRDAARVRERLRSLGERRARTVASRPTEGWDSLTASELQIVRLVAGGATNRQVAEQLHLSPHTVSTHLWHAFTKLGISSRVELTRLVLDHDVPTR
ncbi:ATP-binding protein [Nonomuraea sp. NPDC050328]|uniref:ATP-binding protein n=1 Tax=Nonomuraea sp. NPDC050328 TaxID=3364361 RepID=UPI0037BB430C